jgi:hypothetical protein
MSAARACDIAATFGDAAVGHEGLDQLRSTSSQDLDARLLVSAAAIYALLVMSFWLAFVGPTDAFQSLVTASIVFAMFVGVPAVLAIMRKRFLARMGFRDVAAYGPPGPERVLRTATGWLPMREAELLVLSIPVALCGAAILIGLVFKIVRYAA